MRDIDGRVVGVTGRLVVWSFVGIPLLILLALSLDFVLDVDIGGSARGPGKHGMESGRQTRVEAPAILVLQVVEIAVN